VKLSVVVCVYNMRREAPRTLRSLQASYQRRIDARDYEVIVVENGSTDPLDAAEVRALGDNFSYHFIRDASPSPAAAINFAIARARGEVIAVMIDGARICTPGLLANALRAVAMHERAIVATLGFYLGHAYQRFAMLHGYDRKAEDALLDSIGWPADGYRLFEIGVLDESSHVFVALAESNALFLRRELWAELGGFDERFDQPGGGLVNLDTFYRACELPETELIIQLGEGTFHQLHGGVATNTVMEEFEPKLAEWKAHYRALRGREFDTHPRQRRYFGTIHPATHKQMFDELNHILGITEPLVKRLAAVGDERDQLRDELAELRRELELLHSSHSWYLTRPLRGMFKRFEALRRSLKAL
jgi:glycosyltransferase involved in cell wall biosynthesis